MEDKIAILEAKIRDAEDTAKKYQEHAGRLLRDVAKARAELERERRKAQEPPKWPTLGDKYWFFYRSGHVGFSVWGDFEDDRDLLDIGNCFPTKEAILSALLCPIPGSCSKLSISSSIAGACIRTVPEC